MFKVERIDFNLKLSTLCFVSKELQRLTTTTIAAKIKVNNWGFGPYTPLGVYLEDQAYLAYLA
jgi:hypothetical protein